MIGRMDYAHRLQNEWFFSAPTSRGSSTPAEPPPENAWTDCYASILQTDGKSVGPDVRYCRRRLRNKRHGLDMRIWSQMT
jgi:hypothetical protein